MKVIFDYISVVPLFYFFYLGYNFIIHMNFSDLFLIVWLGLSLFLSESIKLLNYPKSLNWLIKRPNGSFNTDILSRDGISTSPGFPSSHMTTTSFFCVYIILRHYYYKNKNIVKISLFNILLILLMGLARYYKKAHNIYQILAGILLGSILSIVAFKINKKIDLV